MSQERLYELVNQTLMENFGPLGSYAITRRSTSDTDDIFHTALARSVARDIVATLAENGISVKTTTAVAAPAPVAAPVFTPRARIAQPVRPALAPVDRVEVDRRLAGMVAAVGVGQPVSTGQSAGAVPDAPTLDPRDDDALRALVAHHAEVEAAAAAKRLGSGVRTSA
ncbi:hypothetical protein NVV95_17525 [Herbiconiux sp. CPCC 205716]|uniref:Uncharacterized protein n=1 Tax=Herbiconiux gentiana TaxID=2970912 RepID=A0ABT2GJE3_9MICO|nr:hypothetical protein [Herbiconiux gentiana]MCS5716350.1 hypothetical protein [Herbiconiux gentiana]